jgi:hypothetical protein
MWRACGMSNGDITVSQAVELFRKQPLQEQLEMIYTVLINQNETCEKRPECCETKFLKKDEFKQGVKYMTIGIAGVGVGSGGLSFYALLRILGLT